jgi:hypothetical protein
MANFTDMYGYTVTDNGDGTYTREGVTVSQPDDSAALNTFNGMIPEGYVQPDQGQ